MLKPTQTARQSTPLPLQQGMSDTPPPTRWHVVLWLVLPAGLLECCWLYLWRGFPTSTRPWVFQALFAGAFAAYMCAVVGSYRLAALPRRIQALLVIGGALVFQLTVLPAPYAFSDDIFRYVWDGRISAVGIDPYRYAPDDPALAPLRDNAIWQPINAKEQPSPYPPVLEAWFALVYRLCPESVLAMKGSMVAVNMLVIGLLLLLLRMRQQPPLRALIYAWSPQVVFQIGFSGHNEPIVLVCLLGGLVLGQSVRRRAFMRLAGAVGLALAALAKLVPVLIFPVLLRRWGWRAASVYLATLVTVYGALLLRGQQIFAGVSVEAHSAQFNDSIHYIIYFLARRTHPASAETIASLLVAGGLLVVIFVLLCQRGSNLLRPMGTLMAAYVLLAASVAPWYSLWVLPFVALGALPCVPQVRNLGTWAQVVGSYWLIFSWTATFSELFYTMPQGWWRIMHIAEYGIPTTVCAVVWIWAIARSSQRPTPTIWHDANYASDNTPVVS